MRDPFADMISIQDRFVFENLNAEGVFSLSFFAFNTVVTVRGYFYDGISQGDFVKLPGDSDKPRSEFMPSVDSSCPQELRLKAKETAEGLILQCREFERILSRTRPDSEISRINKVSKEAFEICPLAWEALEQGLFYSAKSEGLFDITMGAVTRLWDFNKGVKPSKLDIVEALGHVDYRNIKLYSVEQEGERRYFVQKADSDAFVDLGGTAKGFIADKLCAYLKKQGVDGAFVNLGGNVAVYGGKHDGSAWRIGVKNPFDKEKIYGLITLHEGSVVTSGLYERCFTHKASLYHHILDCKTGYPVETDIAGVTVVAPSSAEADGYSTTLFSRGSTNALEFLNKEPKLEGLVITDTGLLKTSRGLTNFETA